MAGGATVRAYLGLGSNLGDRHAYLRGAVDELGATPGIAVSGVSDVYETDPVGGPDQDPFWNLVVAAETVLTPRQLLGLCQQLEATAGRVREERWGPRTLDVDVLWIEGYTSDAPDLTVPHPRMWERRFVLAPLSELAPELLPVGWEQRAEGEVRRLGPLA
jgi:2-amino-4-hydroxy-6-hydroxymethyldihydropteridine diphosphokinase